MIASSVAENKITLEIINFERVKWSLYERFNSKESAIKEIIKINEFIRSREGGEWWDYINMSDIKEAVKYISFC